MARAFSVSCSKPGLRFSRSQPRTSKIAADAARTTISMPVPAAKGLDLHRLYRAMAWLGDEFRGKAGRGAVDALDRRLIVEELFERAATT